MIDHTFGNQQSAGFWQQCRMEIPAPFVELAFDLLRILDEQGNTSSVRSRYPSKGEYASQGKTSLLDHSIRVAEICLACQDGRIVRDLSVIAGLGHDLGKLEQVQPRGRYTAILHAHWGAEFVIKIINGRLQDRQQEAIVSAIRDHHISGNGTIHRVLRAADALAREGGLWNRTGGQK